jgi:hypothetical protein
MNNLPKYVYRSSITDRVLAYEDELTNETLTRVVKESQSANFNVWRLHTLGDNSWYSLKDDCSKKKENWKCNCIKCQLKGML